MHVQRKYDEKADEYPRHLPHQIRLQYHQQFVRECLRWSPNQIPHQTHPPQSPYGNAQNENLLTYDRHVYFLAQSRLDVTTWKVRTLLHLHVKT